MIREEVHVRGLLGESRPHDLPCALRGRRFQLEAERLQLSLARERIAWRRVFRRDVRRMQPDFRCALPTGLLEQDDRKTQDS
jgi:hypothetical protein